MILDADMGLANIDVILGLVPRYNLAHVFAGEKKIEDILQAGPAGLRIVPGGSGIEELANLEPLALTKLLKEIAVFDQRLDYLFVDTGAGISRQVLAFILAADEILLVTTPEPTALTDAYGLIKVFSRHQGKGKLKLIINMVRSEQEGYDAAQKLTTVVQQFLNIKIEVAGFIPADAAVQEAVRRHQAYILASPRAPASLSTIKIASSLGERAGNPTRGIQGFFEHLVSFIRVKGK
jgi:flagellar biosynthesis protein FlhG